MKLQTESFIAQDAHWPPTGRHILAQFDAESIIVYQAYRPAIGHFAAEHNSFGGEFSFERMSWIKPNFLWMMYRSGWGTKEGQEVTLAIRLKRTAFDEILAQAVYSSYIPKIYQSEAVWQTAVKSSNVRLQWDPDHAPNGIKMERRAIQLGLRGAAVRSYACDWIIDIEDISYFVAAQRIHAHAKADYNQLITPREQVYPVTDQSIAAKLGLSVTME
jgi:hypothetical protein